MKVTLSERVIEGETLSGKECSKCGNWKPLNLFDKRKGGLGDVRANCKDCRRAYIRKYNKLEHVTQKRKDYYENNKEQFKKSALENYHNNINRIKEQKKFYRKTHKKEIDEKNKAYYSENRDKILAQKKIYNRKTRVLKREYYQMYYDLNAEGLKKYQAMYRKSNKEKMRIYYARRKARKSGLPKTLSEDQYSKTLRFFNGNCALTGCDDNIDLEHAIPIAVGHGGTTFENCYPLSHRLNLSKNDSNIFEWFEANRQRFNLEQSRFDRLIEWLGKANGMTVEEYRDYVYWCHANPRIIDERRAQ